MVLNKYKIVVDTVMIPYKANTASQLACCLWKP